MPPQMHFFLAAAVAAAGMGLATAVAEDASGRYTMTPTHDGFIRLDTQTGAMSLCTGKDGDWACRAMPDDQKKLQDRIVRLEEDNRALKEENRRLGDVMGLNLDKPKNGAGPDAPGEQGQPHSPHQGFKLPTERDLDQAFDYIEGMLNKLRDRLKKLEEEEKKNGTVPL